MKTNRSPKIYHYSNSRPVSPAPPSLASNQQPTHTTPPISCPLPLALQKKSNLRFREDVSPLNFWHCDKMFVWWKKKKKLGISAGAERVEAVFWFVCMFVTFEYGCFFFSLFRFFCFQGRLRKALKARAAGTAMSKRDTDRHRLPLVRLLLPPPLFLFFLSFCSLSVRIARFFFSSIFYVPLFFVFCAFSPFHVYPFPRFMYTLFPVLYFLYLFSHFLYIFVGRCPPPPPFFFMHALMPRNWYSRHCPFHYCAFKQLL